MTLDSRLRFSLKAGAWAPAKGHYLATIPLARSFPGLEIGINYE